MAAMAKSITVGLLALGLLSGCQSSSKKWYGTWVGELDRADPSMPDNDVKRTVNSIRIEIKPDGTFTMLESGFDKEGTHRLGSRQAFLTVTRMLGRPIEQLGAEAERLNQDLVLTWEPNGTVSFTDPRGFDGGTVVLRRRAP
jgi:hypothetical protein